MAASPPALVLTVPPPPPPPCKGHPTPTGGLTNGSAFQLPNGVYLDACFVFKAGWTDWHALLLRATKNSSKGGDARGFFPYAIAPLVPRYTPHPHSCATVRLILVRNPFERILSYYLDKVVASCNHGPRPQLHCSKSGYWPRGLKLNASFGETVAMIAQPGAEPNSLLSALHYAPIASSYTRCVHSQPRHRVLKLEYMDRWYASLVAELGLQSAVASGWRTPGGCFFVPGHSAGGCRTALEPPPPLDRLSGSTSSRSVISSAGHSKGAHDKMAAHYTPEIARVVAAHWREDLLAFDYPEWDGDVRNPWA